MLVLFLACRKMCANPNLIRFFPHIDCWCSPLAEICLRQDTCFFQPVQFIIYLLYSRERDVSLFLNIGWAWSFTWNCAFTYVNLPRPSGNFCLSSCFNFSVLVVELSNLRQNVLIGQSQRLNFSIQSVPNRLSVVLAHRL